MSNVIGTLAKQLIALLEGVTELQGRVSFSAGTDSDPQGINLLVPGVVVTFAGDADAENQRPDGRQHQNIRHEFVVSVFIVNEKHNTNMVDVNLPVLESVINSIKGVRAQGPTGQPTNYKWKYEGQRLLDVKSDRLHYAQRFSVLGPK